MKSVPSSSESKQKSIAIIGATSHIAKGLISSFSQSNDSRLFLFGRNPEKIKLFLREEKINLEHFTGTFEELSKYDYDCIINCVGIGRYDQVENVFEITERYDNLVISYLQRNINCIYINCSSGAVYGNFQSPAVEDSEFQLKINHLKRENYYSIAKIHSEAKHRALKHLNIVDIRIFSYFSHFIDLNSGFLITEIINSILHKRVLETDQANITRDYSGPSDLFSLILKCLERGKINEAFDLYSKSPLKKFELLEFYLKNYGLKYAIRENKKIESPSGNKDLYFSKNHNAKTLGFEPKYSSMETVAFETKLIIKS